MVAMPARRLHVLVAGAGAAVPIRMIPYGNELPNRINLFRLFRLVSVAVLICFDSFGSDFFRPILVSTPKNRRIHSVRRFERITATEQPACDGGAERSPCAPAAPAAPSTNAWTWKISHEVSKMMVVDFWVNVPIRMLYTRLTLPYQCAISSPKLPSMRCNKIQGAAMKRNDAT